MSFYSANDAEALSGIYGEPTTQSSPRGAGGASGGLSGVRGNAGAYGGAGAFGAGGYGGGAAAGGGYPTGLGGAAGIRQPGLGGMQTNSVSNAIRQQFAGMQQQQMGGLAGGFARKRGLDESAGLGLGNSLGGGMGMGAAPQKMQRMGGAGGGMAGRDAQTEMLLRMEQERLRRQESERQRLNVIEAEIRKEREREAAVERQQRANAARMEHIRAERERVNREMERERRLRQEQQAVQARQEQQARERQQQLQKARQDEQALRRQREEQTRKQAEAHRKQAEEARQRAEVLRKQREESQRKADEARKKSEAARKAAEEKNRKEREEKDREAREREKERQERLKAEREERQAKMKEEREKREAENKERREKEAAERKERDEKKKEEVLAQAGELCDAAQPEFDKAIELVESLTSEGSQDDPMDVDDVSVEDAKRMYEEASSSTDEAASAITAAEKSVAEAYKFVQEKMKDLKHASKGSPLFELREELKTLESSTASMTSRAKAAKTKVDKLRDAKMKPLQKLRDARRTEARSKMAKISKATDATLEEVGTEAREALAAFSEVDETLGAKLTKEAEANLARVTKDIQVARERREKVEREKAAQLAAQKAMFEQYDLTKDGSYDAEDVAAFALGEFKVTLTEKQIEQIQRSLDPRKQGIKLEKLQQLKVKVGVIRESQREAEKLKELQAEVERIKGEAGEKREAAEKASADFKELYNALSSDAHKELDETQQLAKISEAADALKSVGELTQVAMKFMTTQYHEIKNPLAGPMTALRDQLQSMTAQLKPLSKMVDGEEQRSMQRMREKIEKAMAAVKKNAAGSVTGKIRDMQRASAADLLAKTAAASEQLEKSREHLSEGDAAELVQKIKDAAEARRGQVVYDSLRAHMKENDMGREDLEEKITEDGEFSTAKFLEVLGTIEALAPLGALLGEDYSPFDPASFINRMKAFYKCTLKTVMHEGLSLSGKLVRKIAKGDVLEALGEPETPADVEGVLRVKCRLGSDVGYVTVKGNRGGSFLEKCEAPKS